MQKLMTEKQRHTWSALALVVGLSALPMSLSLLAIAIYIRFVVDEELELVQGMGTATLPYFLAFTGTFNFLSGLLLMSSMARAHRPSSREAAIKLMFMSIIVNLVASGFVFAACLFCFIQKAMLPSIFQEGLSRAMQQYRSVPTVKVRLDLLQMEYECCGDSSYKDWFQVPWVPEDLLVVDSKEIQAHLGVGGSYTNDDVPFSCCDPASFRPCIHHHVVTNHLHHNYDHRVNITLYSAGCRQALMDFFGSSLLQPVGLSLLSLFFTEMAVLAVSRLLQTSMQNAIDSGDVTAAAIGYLFQPPKDLAKQGDVEAGEKQPLLEATDTEGETTEEPTTAPSSADEGPDFQQYPISDTDMDSTPPPLTDEDHFYENVGPENFYENLYDDVEVVGSGMDSYPYPPWEAQPGENGEPLFPSEWAGNEGQHNSLRYARRRGSRAFDSLGIQPPSQERRCPSPPPPPLCPFSPI